ncbi:hypothetical protein CEE37_08720 [candidate division LCP-89 bacterium B3_LCP]|uniref:Uncharacterized protein n=1 Tax=candidate division LCP-89 bacterium B3_LCP TaxID=2012998 RepID=A0A532UZK5_UNCL8|nr:MAG: hypothetical protein CEE37_08720 [candidate division LCP-89 bacterium B3_LCP]
MELIIQSPPRITLATNTFINVPIVLKYEDTPLIEMVEVIRKQNISFTTQIPVYHSDGTYLAKIKGNRVYPTEEGKNANIEIRNLQGKFIASLDNREIFVLTHSIGTNFKADAELYAPEGHLVKCSDAPKPELFDVKGNSIQVGGVTMRGNTIQNMTIGVWLRKDGSCSIGVP